MSLDFHLLPNLDKVTVIFDKLNREIKRLITYYFKVWQHTIKKYLEVFQQFAWVKISVMRLYQLKCNDALKKGLRNSE